MPIHDWQFWVVTVLFCVALWRVVRIVFPKKRSSGCSGCGSAGSAKSSSSKRVKLTVQQTSPRQ